MVNKFFYIKGGSETYYFTLKRLLEKKGHQVIDFSMNDERNLETKYSDYFVRHIDYHDDMNFVSKVKAAINIIYSYEAKNSFEKLVKATEPDIVHLHIFQHQISPSILDVVKKYQIPTVYTAHDLKMVCLNYKMMHHGKICEKCKNKKYYHCFLNKCVKNSLLKSCVNTAEGYFHKWRHSYDVIDEIITPSDFYRKKLIEFGIDSKHIYHIPNFTDSKVLKVNRLIDYEKYYLYFGRLSEEKGVLTLLDAFRENTLCLKIVGTGPLEEKIKNFILQNNIKNIELLGFMSGQELTDIVANAKAVFIPSEWYENGPYSAIEALQLSRPIIGANIGGIPELVNGNGFLYKNGNVNSLCDVLKLFEKQSLKEYQAMKQKSWVIYNRFYTQQAHYEALSEIYKIAIKKHSK